MSEQEVAEILRAIKADIANAIRKAADSCSDSTSVGDALRRVADKLS